LKDSLYFRQAELLLQILPHISKETDFAIKGGTAINFFIRDLPRLSVDVDLTYLPITPRNEALAGIENCLQTISDAIKRSLPEVSIAPKRNPESNTVSGLIVNKKGITVKIEPNLIVRGAVCGTESRELSSKAQRLFERSSYVETLSFADLYGGKICAALTRQHPRDLFDIKVLFENEGLTEQIRKAFIVYLISHPRPINEVLNPGLQDLTNIFELEFKHMLIERQVTLKELMDVRKELIEKIKESFTLDERKFILSIKSKEPDWGLLDIKNIENLPAIRWKILNIEKMKKAKHQQALKKLKKYLQL